MSLPPRPYTYICMTARADAQLGNGHVYLLDANGRKIASIWGTADEKIALAEAICKASEKKK